MEQYHFIDKINEGAFGKVYRSSRKMDGLLVAIKVMSCDRITKLKTLDNNEVPSEVFIMSLTNGKPGIIRMNNYFEETNKFYIEMEHPPNSTDLFEFIPEDGLPETASKMIFKQLVSAAQELYELNIIHGDIKSDNVLVNKCNLNVKLIDFGL